MDAGTMTEQINPLLTPLVQWGFAGLSAILLAGIAWLVNKMFTVIEQNGSIISSNTNAINELSKNIVDMNSNNKHLLENMLQRPCVAKFTLENKKE
jgi:type II secretory pathway component PulC